MPDITMCVNQHCHLRLGCYRHVAKPNSLRQSYADFSPKGEHCENYMPCIEVVGYRNTQSTAAAMSEEQEG